ncbi:MAG: IS30 family transposase [Congregibacter sp.]|jgi:IS30 family transposase
MGDWEIDLFIDKGHSGALVTNIERKTSLILSTRVDEKSQKNHNHRFVNAV